MKTGICGWCYRERELTKHHYPTKKSEGGKDIVLICSSCHLEYHKQEDRMAAYYKQRKLRIARKNKEEKESKDSQESVVCEYCRNTLKKTQKRYQVQSVFVCFKCYLAVEREERRSKVREQKESISQRIQLKKYLCSTCNMRKNDLEVTFTFTGARCIKDGNMVVRILDIDEKVSL